MGGTPSRDSSLHGWSRRPEEVPFCVSHRGRSRTPTEVEVVNRRPEEVQGWEVHRVEIRVVLQQRSRSLIVVQRKFKDGGYTE
jgi:hypothetical protein